MKKELRKITEVRVPENQFMSTHISRIFYFTFNPHHSNVSYNQVRDEVCR